MKRTVSLIMVFVLVLALFAGCTTNETPETTPGTEPTNAANPTEVPSDVVQELNWNVGSDPKTLDPQLNSASDGGHVINNTFEGLYRHVDNVLTPAIAYSHEVSADGLTYTFKLKETKWSDGQPLTANDFAYAWKRALDPTTASEYAFQLFYIKGGQAYFEGTGSADEVAISVLDDYTLQVELVSPTAYFADLLTFYTYMPTRQDVVESGAEGTWASNPELVVSNGPFVLTEYSAGDKIVLVKNENYWNADNVKLQKIIGHMIVDESTTLTAYESGELDVIDSVPNQEIPRLSAEDPTFKILPQLGTYYYLFNVTKPPVDDIRVRKALTLAIDRKSIVENVTKAGQRPAAGYVPYGLYDANGDEFRTVAGDYGINPDAANIDEARALLTEAGYPDGVGFPTIEVIYNTSEGHKAIAEAIQEMWKKNLNIDVTITNQDFAVFQDTRHQGNYTVARAGWLGDYTDPMTFLDLWTSYSGNNDTQWKSEEFDQIIEESKVKSGQERMALLYKAEKMILEDNQILMPIYFYTDPIMVKDRLQGWEKTALGHWFFGSAVLTE